MRGISAPDVTVLIEYHNPNKKDRLITFKRATGIHLEDNYYPTYTVGHEEPEMVFDGMTLEVSGKLVKITELEK